LGVSRYGSGGIHAILADGDGADDDGVSFGSIRGWTIGPATIVVSNAGGARLDAWIDFNADGLGADRANNRQQRSRRRAQHRRDVPS
jgi:hypothetical protein